MSIYRGVGGSGNATDDATIAEVSTLASNAANSATAAAASETAAASSASGASSSATSASTSATNAASSAASAASSASSAASSVTSAASQASAAASSAAAAAVSAGEASTSATNAATSAASSASARDSAETYMLAAQTAETSAETAYANTLAIYGDTTDVAAAVSAASGSASSASSSASAAASSASSASTSATNAANSATAALASQNAAASSASGAASTASNITALFNDLDAVNTAVELSEGYKNDAGASAVSAAASASSASTSATNAASSATQAAASAASASEIVLGVASGLPDIAPTLNLDFANSKVLDPRITFTRASTATYYDGKTVAKAEENLLLRSQEFDQSPWSVNAAGVATAPVRTANYGVAPDGTSTADRAVFSLNGGSTSTDIAQVLQNAATTSGATYTFSVWAKATDGASSYSLQLAGPGAATSMAVTGTWTRFSVTGAASGASFDLQIRLRGGQTPATSDSADILLWGAQLEQRSSVTAYTPTTTQAITNYIPVLQTAAAGVARFDHNPVTGESLGLLIEEQRTNLLTYSSEFNWAEQTTSGPSATLRYRKPNAAIAPDGTQTAQKISGSTDNALQRIYSSTTGVTLGSPVTYSIYAKAGEYTRVGIKFTTNASSDFVVDLSNGSVVQTGNSTSQFVTPVGNGWYRIGITVTPTISPVVWVSLVSPSALTTTFVGDGYSGIYIWGAQLEAGAFPTSYIKTEASQVTRSADAASMTGTNFSSWYRADEGTLYADYLFNATLGTVRPVVSIANPSTGNYGDLINFNGTSTTNTQVIFEIRKNNSDQALISLGNVSLGTPYKSAGGYAVNNIAAAHNGNLLGTDTSALVPAATTLWIGQRTDGNRLNGHIRKLAYYPARLNNTALQAITS